MRTPQPPAVAKFNQLSPSLYEAALRCKARAAWTAHGDGQSIPHHPKALLGVCLHGVVEDAHNGKFSGLGGDELLQAARVVFDQRAGTIYERAHPLLRAKFNSPQKIPYYHLYRERAAAEAEVIAGRLSGPPVKAGAVSPASSPHQQVEKKLSSKDGLLAGRPDFVDLHAAEVVDYKTGAASEDAPNGISAAEGRQLRLYVHLAHENDLAVTRAVIARSDGSRASLDVSNEEAAKEGRQARQVLVELNKMTGKTFEEAASPAVGACSHCPCIPFCEPFWQSATTEWVDQVGVHFEGKVSAVDESTIQGIELVTLQMVGQRGTVSSENTSIEHIPKIWLTAGGSFVPREGDIARVVHGRLTSTEVPTVIRVDRATTSIWTAPPSTDK